MDQRILTRLQRIGRAAREPRDYFRGVLRHPDPAPDNLLFFVRRSARELWPTDGSFSFHHRWVLVVALAGTGTLLMDRKPYRLRPGMALLVPPLHLHGFENVSQWISWWFITFEWPGHAPLEREWHSPRRLDRQALEDLEATGAFLLGNGDGSLAATHLQRILHRLSPPARSSRKASLPLIAKIQAAAESLPGARLPEIARTVGISESHLRARFRREAGMSLGRYVRESKLRRMALRIRDEGLSIQTAADLAGYPDIFSFSRAFRRTLGHPPSDLLKARKMRPDLTG